MAENEREEVPIAVPLEEDIKDIHARLDAIEEKLDFVWGEVFQRYGKRVGRDIGILYGLVFSLYLCMLYLMLSVAF